MRHPTAVKTEHKHTDNDITSKHTKNRQKNHSEQRVISNSHHQQLTVKDNNS